MAFSGLRKRPTLPLLSTSTSTSWPSEPFACSTRRFETAPTHIARKSFLSLSNLGPPSGRSLPCNGALYEIQEQISVSLYAHRTSSSYCDHRHSRSNPLPRFCAGEACGQKDVRSFERKAGRPRRVHVQQRLRRCVPVLLGLV